jgi:hypothetical protein
MPLKLSTSLCHSDAAFIARAFASILPPLVSQVSYFGPCCERAQIMWHANMNGLIVICHSNPFKCNASQNMRGRAQSLSGEPPPSLTTSNSSRYCRACCRCLQGRRKRSLRGPSSLHQVQIRCGTTCTAASPTGRIVTRRHPVNPHRQRGQVSYCLAGKVAQNLLPAVALNIGTKWQLSWSQVLLTRMKRPGMRFERYLELLSRTSRPARMTKHPCMHVGRSVCLTRRVSSMGSCARELYGSIGGGEGIPFSHGNSLWPVPKPVTHASGCQTLGISFGCDNPQ